MDATDTAFASNKAFSKDASNKTATSDAFKPYFGRFLTVLGGKKNWTSGQIVLERICCTNTCDFGAFVNSSLLILNGVVY